MAGWLDAARLRAAAVDGLADARRRRCRRRTDGRRAMLWSILKILVFLGIAAALAFGAAWILETPGRGADRLRRPRVLRLADRLRDRRRGAGAAGAAAPEAARLPRRGGALPARRRDRDQPLFLAQPRAARLRRAVRRHGRARRGRFDAGDEEGAARREAAAPPGPDAAAERAGGRAERRPRQGASTTTRRCCATTAPGPSASRA